MKAIHLVALSAILLCWVPRAPAQYDLPEAAKEILKQFEAETSEVEKKIEAEVAERAGKTTAELKKLQDLLCKEAKLEEAIAVRDMIRSIKAGRPASANSDLPPAAAEIYKKHEAEVAAILKKTEGEIEKRRDKIAAELKKLLDQFCKEAKLDEALAVRNLLRDGVVSALADPGYVNNGPADIGKVFYYEATGVISANDAIYGTDIFTTGSHLAMAAVHSGVLKVGQKGVVRVTILPGQKQYASETRHGITSSPYGPYNVSFKVERAYGFALKKPVNPMPDKAP